MFQKYSEQAPLPDRGWGGMTGLWETAIYGCNVPSNRGASDTDRTTWSSVVDNTPGSTQCNPQRDATVEEIHHLLAEAAAKIYPDEWGLTASSKAGSLVLALNGDCGWGNEWINPGGLDPSCTGTYAYDDETCDEACRIIEGVYWASVSWIGGLYTSLSAHVHGNEWLMTVPDSGMTALPEFWYNAVTLEEGAPDLYEFISDTTSQTHLWLPRIMPNGVYEGDNKSNDESTPSVLASIVNKTVGILSDYVEENEISLPALDTEGISSIAEQVFSQIEMEAGEAVTEEYLEANADKIAQMIATDYLEIEITEGGEFADLSEENLAELMSSITEITLKLALEDVENWIN